MVDTDTPSTVPPRWWEREWFRQTLPLLPATLGLLLPGDLTAKFVAVWDVYAIVYLFLTWRTFRGRTEDELRALVSGLRRRRVAEILLGRPSEQLPQVAAVVALIATIDVMPTFSESSTPGPVLLIVCVVAVLAGWAALQTGFALGHMTLDLARGGLCFPGDEPRGAVDYLYFAIGVGATFGATDVQVTSRAMRRRVLVHSIAAFLFNTLIVAASVSIIATLVSR